VIVFLRLVIFDGLGDDDGCFVRRKQGCVINACKQLAKGIAFIKTVLEKSTREYPA
jgi:hypothetical protein